MLILAAGNKPDAQKGLSLIELMVVLVVMALVTSLVLVALPPRDSAAKSTANSVYGVMVGLTDAAIIEGRPFGLNITKKKMTVLAFSNGVWRPAPQFLTQLPEDVHVQLSLLEGFSLPEQTGNIPRVILLNALAQLEEPQVAPMIVFNPAGDTTPLEMTFTDDRQAWQISLDNAGLVEVDRVAF